MFDLIYAGSVSACFELTNTVPYDAPNAFAVLLNGEMALEGRTNVFSLFGLKPDTEYTVEVRSAEGSKSLTFRTGAETCALSVKDFGAVGDGKTDDTQAIQRAILMCPEGARLRVPQGTYHIAPIFLKSHMTLELEQGATLLGMTDKSAYPVLPGEAADQDGGEAVNLGTFEGIVRDMYAPLVSAAYAEDITIVGPGLVDGNAQNGEWWKTYREDPVARPRLIFLNRCSNVVVHGLRAANSASWQIHPYCSTNLSFYDVGVSAPKVSPNTDALDPDTCDRVNIIGCRFSVGDDCIAIKSGKIDFARKMRRSANRHTIRNCLMEYGHGAITLGSEISGGVTDLNVSQCLFRRTDRGLRIKSRRGRGDTCRIDGVCFENIRMEGVLTPIVINLWYNAVDPDGNSDYVQSREALPVDENTPVMGSFAFRHMECTDAEVAACYVDGLPERPVERVELEDVHVTFREDAHPGVPAMMRDAEPRVKQGLYFDNVRQVSVNNVRLEGVEGEPLTALHVDDIETEGFAG